MKNIINIQILLLALNLQLFSGENANGTQVTTQSSLSPQMKTFYDKNLLDNAKPNLVHHQFGQKRPIPKRNGKTIEFRKFQTLPKALTPLTEGVTPSKGTLTVTNITATVSQYGYYVELSDVLEMTAIDNVIVETTELIGNQGGLTMDTVVRNEINSGTSVVYAPKINPSTGAETIVWSRGALDTTCMLTGKLVAKIAAMLKADNVPKIDGDYVCILHPYSHYEMTRDPEWLEAHKYTDAESIYEGEIGKLHGVRFVESSEAQIFAGADLASDSRTLTVNLAAGYSGAITSIAFDGGTVAANALVGRKININGVVATITANTASALTFASTNFGSIADNAVIYPGEGGAEGAAVFSCLFLGKDAYGVVDVEGGNMQVIVKPKGSGGTTDPLDQRSTIGWKAMEVAKILHPERIIRLECCSKDFSAGATAN